MSVRPLDIASQEVGGGTRPTKPRSACRTDYAGTLCSSVATVLVLLWAVFAVYFVAENVRVPYCENLVTDKSVLGTVMAMIFIFIVFVVQLIYACRFRNRLGNRFGTIGTVVVMIAGVVVILGFPNLGGQSTFGLFHSSPPSPATDRTVHNSEYWSRNVGSCVCRTERCEEVVYRGYFEELYGLRAVQSLGFHKYTKLDEVKRLVLPAQHMNGTSLNDGDRSSPRSDSRYHEVCYSRSAAYGGHKKVCYDCYACEEKYIRDKQKMRWIYGNKLFVLSLLLVVSNVIVFVAESWARYMG